MNGTSSPVMVVSIASPLSNAAGSSHFAFDLNSSPSTRAMAGVAGLTPPNLSRSNSLSSETTSITTSNIAASAARDDRVTAASKLSEESIGANMTLADEHHGRGLRLRKTGRFDAAVVEYTRAIELNPRHFKAHFNRGFAYDKLERFDLAIRDYSKAITLEPNNAYAYYNRGISRDRSGEYQGAVADFTR